MAGVWERWGDVLLAAILTLPLLACAAAIRARRLGWRDGVAEVAALAGPLPWLWMILTPLPQESDVHLTPFHELSWYVNAPPANALVQLVGNLAVFAAFGAAAPVRWRLPLAVIALGAAAGSATVEVAQYLLDIGRVASVDDVLLNTAGAVLAALATRPWWRTRRDRRVMPESIANGTVGAR